MIWRVERDLKPSNSMLKSLQIGLNFCWKLFEWIRDRYKKTIIDSTLSENIVLKHSSL